MAKKNRASDSSGKNAAETIAAPTLYVTLGGESHTELVERKSVFLGHAAPVKTEDEAMEFVRRIRGMHGDATHNVYAYSLGGGSRARYSDDGEPQGTAGLPVLEVITKSGFTDACIVVTRYFGGILLGAGGLVRAYSASAKQAVDAAGIVAYESFDELELTLSYSDYQKITKTLEKYEARVDSSDFGGEVSLGLAVKETVCGAFTAELSEISAGRINAKKTGKRFDRG